MGSRSEPAGLDGVLVVAKPPGPTSHDVVALVRRLAGTRRVGHGGTLDPFAGGVLPVFLGRATRLVEYHLADRKQYRATICFGASSTTDDLDGELTPIDGPLVTRAAVEAGLRATSGSIEQRPPAFSARRVAGRRAYALARAGATVVLPPRRITIHQIELIEWDDRDPGRPIAIVDVECSTGTYVRAIARDLGEALGSGAYLGALVRTASGGFRIEDAHPLDVLRAAATEPGTFAQLLRPIDDGLGGLPVVLLTSPEVADISAGRFIRPAAGLPAGGQDEAPLRLVGPDGTLVGIGLRRGGRLVPTKVLIDALPGPAAHDRADAEDLGAGAATNRANEAGEEAPA